MNGQLVYQSIFDSEALAALLDVDSKSMALNKALKEQLHFNDELLEHYLYEQDYSSLIEQALKELEKKQTYQCPLFIFTQHSGVINFNLLFFPAVEGKSLIIFTNNSKEFAAKEHFETCQRISKSGFWSFNTHEKAFTFSDQAAHIHEIEGHNNVSLKELLTFYQGPSAEKFLNEIKLALKTQHNFDLSIEMITRKGSKKNIQFCGKSLIGQSGRVYGLEGFFKDKTYETSLMKDFVETINKLETFEHSLDSHFIFAKTNPEGIITFVNEKFVKISGYRADELIGQSHKLVNSGFHPDSFFKKLWDTINEKKVWKGIVKNKRKNGEYYWVDTTITPILDQLGNIKEFQSIRHDITERIQQKEIINRQEKLSTIGETTAQILHDVMNPLTIIEGTAVSIQRKSADLDQEAIEKYSDRIIDSSKRIKKIFKNMKDIAKNTEQELEKINLNKLVSEAIDFNKSVLSKRNIGLAVEHLPEWVNIYGVKGQFEQVLINLIKNSADAIQDLDKKWIKISASLNSSTDIVKLQITDSGQAIPPEIASEIFKPLFTTKGEEGTGLGLAICKKIMLANQGDIEYVKDKENTTFQISFKLSSL